MNTERTTRAPDGATPELLDDIRDVTPAAHYELDVEKVMARSSRGHLVAVEVNHDLSLLVSNVRKEMTGAPMGPGQRAVLVVIDIDHEAIDEVWIDPAVGSTPLATTLTASHALEVTRAALERTGATS